jgi:excisionase family DNA binding protein
LAGVCPANAFLLPVRHFFRGGGRLFKTSERETEMVAVEPMLLTMRETCKALALCDRTIRTLTQGGELRCVRLGRAVRYDPADIRAWIEQNKSKPSR